ncbi:MAG: hypothetical protein LBK83_14325 [Treponema sp.]|jgi:hypothetical protein|nr:hypothetical protein [Treponema sp.]
MSTPNITGTIIATGYNCQVRVGANAKDAKPIALVASFQANEDFQVQEATVIGNLGPIALDPQGYTCSITMDGFLPAKGVIPDGEQQYDVAGDGTTAITNVVKDQTRAKFMDQGDISKIEYLHFYNKKSGKVLASFKGVILTSYGINVEGSAYVRNNVQMRALEMIRADNA